MGWLKEHYGSILAIVAILSFVWQMQGRLEARLDRVEIRLERVEQNVAWIKGHIEARDARTSSLETDTQSVQ